MLARTPEPNSLSFFKCPVDMGLLMRLILIPASEIAIDFLLSEMQSRHDGWKALLRKRRGKSCIGGIQEYEWKNVSPLQLADSVGNDTLVNKLLSMIPEPFRDQAWAQIDSSKFLQSLQHAHLTEKPGVIGRPL